MKTKTLLLTFLVAMFFGNAQNLELIDTATQQPATWHYSFQVAPTGSAFISFEVKNNGTALVKSRVHKFVHQTTGSHQTYFSYGAYMYAPSTMYSLQEPLAAGQSLPDINGRVGLETGFDANGSIGTTVVGYTVYDSLNHTDSVNITITYNVTSTAITSSDENPHLSAAWPNPAADQVHFNYLPGTKPASILLFNTTGTEIRQLPLTSTANKATLYISDVAEGIYFYSLVIDGKATVTRKLVIAR